jgi:hypothetical protein
MSFGPDFATALEHIESSFHRIEGGLEMAAGQRRRLLRAFSEGHRSGDDRRLADLVRPVLDDGAWSWPWFDQCAARLEAAGVWPFCWQEEWIETGTRWTGLPSHLQQQFLLGTLASAAYAARDAAQLSDPDVRRHMIPTLKVYDERCDAERYMCDLHRPAIEAGDFSKLPPYFPMCGVHLRTRSISGR